MAQSGFTPISLYYSSTGAAVPSAGNLVAGELALNTNDGKLYYKNSSGVVTLLAGATSGPAGGSTTQVQYNNAGVLAGITGATTNGTALTLIAPVLGTPASGNLVNATGYVGTSSLVTVGALNSGSITSGFGSIDVGADAISGGAITGTTGTFSSTVQAGRVGFGSVTPQATSIIAANGDVTSGVYQYGIFVEPTLSGTTESNAALFTLKAKAATALTVGVGLQIQPSELGAGATIGTNYGLLIGGQTAGTTNYAIYTGAGLVRLGGAVTMSSTLAVTGAVSGAAATFTTGTFSGTVTSTVTGNAFVADRSGAGGGMAFNFSGVTKGVLVALTGGGLLLYDQTAGLDAATFTAAASTIAGTLAVTGAPTFGPGGTGTTPYYVYINAGSGSGGGPNLRFQRNSVDIGHLGSASTIIGGTSSDLSIESITDFRVYTGGANLALYTNGLQVLIPYVWANTGGTTTVMVDSNGALFKLASSRQYKEAFEPYTKGLETVAALAQSPILYRLKSAKGQGVKQAGFIAEDFDALGLSEFIGYGPDGPDSINYGMMATLFVNAIMQQQAQIDALRDGKKPAPIQAPSKAEVAKLIADYAPVEAASTKAREKRAADELKQREKEAAEGKTEEAQQPTKEQ